MTPCEYAEELSRYDVTQSVYSAAYAGEVEAAARRVGVTLSVHVKVDTGMTRIGFSDRDVDEIERVYRSETLRASGDFTHFACSDEKGEDAQAYTRGQYARFESVCRSLMDRGIEVGLRHCCNSGAILAYPEMQMDMVRPGVILYGLPPSDELRDGADLRPVMTLYSPYRHDQNGGIRHTGELWPHLYHTGAAADSHCGLRLCRRVSPDLIQSRLYAGRRAARSRDRPGVHGSDDAGCHRLSDAHEGIPLFLPEGGPRFRGTGGAGRYHPL